MQTKLIAFIASGLFICSANVFAQASFVAGSGTKTCSEYIDLRRKNPNMAEITYTGWLQGYMSGINNSQGARNLKTIEIPEYKTLGLMLESYCLKTPRSIVALEAFRIFNDLAEK